VPRRDPRTHPRVRGFDAAADRYERSRPDYPAAAVRHLGRVLDLHRGRTVVEVGAGTGKFTRAMAPWGAARVAVEPTAGMRRVFAEAVPGVAVVDGAAEALPLPDGFADAVVCAQAFHWFRAAPSLREFARVLRPGGGLGLVWNVRDESADWSRRITAILDRYRGDTPSTRDRKWRPAFADPASPFGPLAFAEFRHAHRAPPSVFVDRFLSVSMVAVLPVAEQRRVADAIRSILASDPATRGRATIAMPYRTWVYWAFRRRAAPELRRRGRRTR